MERQQIRSSFVHCIWRCTRRKLPEMVERREKEGQSAATGCCSEVQLIHGEVDLIDRFVSYYRISMRTKKWTVRVFAQFLDMACCNG
ncbi:hypothetical protein HPB48_026281 [Haemaphysalis longicornis]|uniref:PiggyBac transposable element-derived protein domain-containing protein n=1 Tax=Haemaphysalis longicornis TaxID=44386 RepID=A0A9J6HBM7_HAELO|nr:hypothetical protein HPB48_026281 [Haemaphysalis longicornis]